MFTGDQNSELLTKIKQVQAQVGDGFVRYKDFDVPAAKDATKAMDVLKSFLETNNVDDVDCGGQGVFVHVFDS